MRTNRSYSTDCKFIRKFYKNGEPMVWFKILNYVHEHVEVERWKIVRDVLGKQYCNAKNFHDNYRGQHSNIFSQMHYRRVIDYDKDTKMWSVGEYGWEILNNCNYKITTPKICNTKTAKKVIKPTVNTNTSVVNKTILDAGANSQISVLKAYKNGEKIQVLVNGKWESINDNYDFGNYHFKFLSEVYRVAPKYRPYTKDEFLNMLFKNHGYIKYKSSGEIMSPNRITDKSVDFAITMDSFNVTIERCDYNTILKDYVWINNEVCGVLNR